MLALGTLRHSRSRFGEEAGSFLGSHMQAEQMKEAYRPRQGSSETGDQNDQNVSDRFHVITSRVSPAQTGVCACKYV